MAMAPPLDYEIVLEDEARVDDTLWTSYLDSIAREGWPLDASFRPMSRDAPNLRVVMARRKSDGTHLSSVGWFENHGDGTAYIGTYLTEEEARGHGIGSILWNMAMERMPKNLAMCLIAGPDMEAKYRSKWFPHVGNTLRSYDFGAGLKEALEAILADSSTVRNNLSTTTITAPSVIEKVVDFDSKVTGRDRSVFLRSFFACSAVQETAALFDGDKLLGYGAAVPIPNPSGVYEVRMAPLFAETLHDAVKILLTLVESILSKNPAAVFYLRSISDTAGEELIERIREKVDPDDIVRPCKELYSLPYVNPLDKKRFFMPHSHLLHFDA